MSGTLLPIPDDPRLAELVESWPEIETRYRFPRSVWLGGFETILREHYPQASSADRRLTARHAAPFFLAQGPNVP